MLIWMRDSAGAGILKFFLLGTLLLAVGGLVLMDVGGFFTGNMGSGKIVSGGGVNIGAQEFDRTVRRTLASQGIPAQEAYRLGLIDNILTSEIQNRLFTKESQNLGLRVDDESVTKQIALLAAPLAAEGQSKKQALQQILRTQGISEGEFVTALRQEMANTLLRAAMQPPASLSSPLMAKTLYRYDNERRSANVIVLKNADVKDVKAADEEQLKKFYDANKSDYLIPETRTVTLATLKADMLRKNLRISDQDLRAEYDRTIASFTKPSRRSVEQTVLKTEEEAKKTAEAMKAGNKVANVISQEYEQSGLLPEIAGPVFAAKDGDVVGPVKTSLGWHVIRVKGTTPEDVTPFDDVKEKLRAEVEQSKLGEELYNTGNTIEDRVAGGESLESLVGEYGLTTEKIGPFRVNGNTASNIDAFKAYGGDRDKLIQAAFDYDEGELTPLVETADGQFHFMRIDTVVPDAYRDYADVKADVEKRWAFEQRAALNKARAQKALDDLNAGKTLADVAKENGAGIQTVTNVVRNADTKEPLTPLATAQMFVTDKGKSFSSENNNSFIVGTVTAIDVPKAPDAKGENLAELEDLTGRSMGQDILEQFVNSIAGSNKVRVNKAALDQIYGQSDTAQQQ
ncbi:MAG: hypothetical protein DI626_07730 [Micavibrio aeruginosavorus]|uniref:Periplasmic chaperone PpiD n=1 Tax=Micavibrio aeruginosavorus TaxID=349221 RepID=A0A2W4ZRZ0_9BACT|nr:MAG: hypothetical protein DI626_07730 [Micavibrio aeruginosavorus]